MSRLFQINLGSGAEAAPGWFNVDRLELPNVDRVHDLRVFPYPFRDASASKIKAIDVLEHLPNYTDPYVRDSDVYEFLDAKYFERRPIALAFVEECHRILEPGGELFIQVPHWKLA